MARASPSPVQGIITDAGPCPYRPGRRFHAFYVTTPVDAARYRLLLDNRFRRNGALFYRPMCPGCQACRVIRVAVQGFRPRRDQRRAWARNRDLTFTWHPRGLDAARAALWQRYQASVHGETDTQPPERFLLDDAGIPGGELHAHDAGGRLLGVSVCDLVGDVWSSVYCYWDPDQRHRSLGTVLALAEIAEAARRGMTWWYPGYWVEDCAKMAYKGRFGPAEVLDGDRWLPSRAPADRLGLARQPLQPHPTGEE